MEELNKKIAEWLKLEEFGIYADHEGNYYYMQFLEPSQKVAYYCGQAFHLSLDACFKYIVPKLDSFTLYCGYYLSGYIYRARVAAKSGIWREGQNSINPALAFCKAVEKLIDSQKK